MAELLICQVLTRWLAAADKNLIKFDSALQAKHRMKFLHSIFNILLVPDFLRLEADSAGSAVKIFGGWLPENRPKIGWRCRLRGLITSIVDFGL